MVYVVEGEVEITISGKPLTLKQGDMTIMPANDPHALTAKTPFKMILTMIKS
jgi:quercetin dioxygenase-like cupin family protein